MTDEEKRKHLIEAYIALVQARAHLEVIGARSSWEFWGYDAFAQFVNLVGLRAAPNG